MVCSDMYEAPAAMSPPRVPPVSTEEGLSALSPSLRKHFLASINRNREAFAALAKL
jgi:hypothetical protein